MNGGWPANRLMEIRDYGHNVQVIKGDIIGSGSCATVYRALNICTGQVNLSILDCCEAMIRRVVIMRLCQVLALKEVRLNHFQQTGEHMLELEKEVNCLKNLTHRVCHAHGLYFFGCRCLTIAHPRHRTLSAISAAGGATTPCTSVPPLASCMTAHSAEP